MPIDTRREPTGEDVPEAPRPTVPSEGDSAGTKPGIFPRVFVIAGRVVVIGFVVWHLFYLFIANTEIGEEALDDSVYWYGQVTATDQNWGMFRSPLWRKTQFLSGRIEFDDGSTEWVRTHSEPDDHTAYVRVGGWRLRKLEENIGGTSESSYYEDMRKRYVRYLARQWRAANREDVRTAVRITLFRRQYQIPAPGEPRPDRPRRIEMTEKEEAIVTVDLPSRAEKGEEDS